MMVIVRIWEGLGNQMFQYAYARALALRTGQKVYLDISEYAGTSSVRTYGLCHFRIKQPVTECAKYFPFVNSDLLYLRDQKYLAHKKFVFAGKVMENDCSFKEGLCNLKGLVYLKGWFQSEEYFKEFGSVIRSDLRPKEKIRLHDDLGSIMQHFNTISVHVRRGDFKQKHTILPAGYYQAAVRMISDSVRAPYYIVFSDDIEWVKRNMDFGNRCLYMDSRYAYRDYEELLIMSRCSHNIIANSSFSWWGAWLNDNKSKIVIAPKRWFLKGRMRDINIAPHDWIRI